MNERDNTIPLINPWFFSSSYFKTIIPFLKEADYQWKDHPLDPMSFPQDIHNLVPFNQVRKIFKPLKGQNFELKALSNSTNTRSFGPWDDVARYCVTAKSFLNHLSLKRPFFNPLHYIIIQDNIVEFRKSPWSSSSEAHYQIEFILILTLLKKYFFLDELHCKKISSHRIQVTLPQKQRENSFENKILLKKTLKNIKKEKVIAFVGQGFQDELVKKVIHILQSHALSSDLPLHEVASTLKLSKRTLQRRLSQSNFRFSDLKKITRKVISHRLLTATALPINEISEFIGFSEPSVFTKFFKEWTGISPLSYRNLSFKDAQKLSLSPLNIR